MLPLTASTVTLLIGSVPVDRVLMISSDSATVTRISYEKVGLEVGNTGFGITVYTNLNVFVPAMKQVWAYTSGTPNIGIIFNIQNATNVVRL